MERSRILLACASALALWAGPVAAQSGCEPLTSPAGGMNRIVSGTTTHTNPHCYALNIAAGQNVSIRVNSGQVEFVTSQTRGTHAVGAEFTSRAAQVLIQVRTGYAGDIPFALQFVVY